MIIRIVCLCFLGFASCYPQRLNLPDLDVSTPEEVNSLELDEPVSRSIDPQTRRNSKIEDTVRTVEEIIKSNPALPRLTRGEILDLLENITEVDQQKKLRNPKAVMVVMPYTPTNDKNMEDLYTKAPVTHIIGAEPFKTRDQVSKEKTRRRPPVDNDLAKKPLVSEEKKKYSASFNEKPTTSIRRKRPEATTQPTSTYHPTTYRPTRRRTTKHPNHRYPQESQEFSPNGGIRIIESPKLDPVVPKPFQQPQFHTLDSDLHLEENVKHEVVLKDVPKPQSTKLSDIDFPDSLKTVVKDLNLDSIPDHEEVKAKLEEHNRIKNLLASIGVLPESTTTTTTTSAPSAESVADSLSPEMRDLLMSFGLLPNPDQKPEDSGEKYNPEKAEVSPESYVGFKPLPNDGPGRDDMDALLASFGLGRSARREKSIKIQKKEEQTLNFDMIPSDFKDVVEDLGIERINHTSKEVKTHEIEKTVEKQHVFNPDTQNATEEELKKLEKLINMIKHLEKMNGTATEEDLKKIDLDSLKELVTSLNGENETLLTLEEKQHSPDPTAFDVGVSKNEVKRQESTTVSSTEASGTPSLKDLEESFGGQTEAITEPPVPETTTRRNGFYYLVDWNTFLDIDDTKGKRVNLRFQPTIGDPKRFLSVSVP